MIVAEQRIRRSENTPALARWRITMLEISIIGVLFLAIIAPALEMPRFSFANSGRQLGYLLLALLVIIALDPREFRRVLVLPWPIVLTLGWFWFSLTWSSNLGLSFSRLLLTSIVIWIAFAAVPAIGSARTILFMRIILTLALITNYVVVYLFPDVGTHLDHEGLWRGFMSSKNHAGAICSLTIIIWVFNVPHRQRWIGILVAISSAIFLWQSGSRTPTIMLIIALALTGLLYLTTSLIRKVITQDKQDIIDRIIISVFGFVAFLLIYLTFFTNILVNLTSNPEIFSGRNQLWQPLLLFYLDHPFLGSGFGGFWVDSQTRIHSTSRAWLDNVSQGHNGYLEIAVQTGLPGLLLALFAGLFWPIREFLRLIMKKYKIPLVVVGIFIFCIGSNITESGFFLRDTLWQVFLMLALAMLHSGQAKGLRIKASRSRLVRRRRTTESGKSL